MGAVAAAAPVFGPRKSWIRWFGNNQWAVLSELPYESSAGVVGVTRRAGTKWRRPKALTPTVGAKPLFDGVNPIHRTGLRFNF